jgi:hypothetical protein
MEITSTDLHKVKPHSGRRNLQRRYDIRAQVRRAGFVEQFRLADRPRLVPGAGLAKLPVQQAF